MPLTVIQVRSAKPGIKPDGTVTAQAYKMTDERGLYLEVKSTGSKLWRFRYRFDGKEKLLSVGNLS